MVSMWNGKDAKRVGGTLLKITLKFQETKANQKVLCSLNFSELNLLEAPVLKNGTFGSKSFRGFFESVEEVRHPPISDTGLPPAQLIYGGHFKTGHDNANFFFLVSKH
jgi:hypothetical protein